MMNSLKYYLHQAPVIGYQSSVISHQTKIKTK
jgi:hypothetical protein